MFKKLPLLALAAVTFAFGACGGGDDDSGTPELSATLSSFEIKLDKTTISPGEINIVAKNVANEPHELVIIRSDLAPDALPVVDGKVPEDQVDVISEIPEFDGGKTEEEVFDLAAGKYLLICNIAAHYKAGMFIGLTVE